MTKAHEFDEFAAVLLLCGVWNTKWDEKDCQEMIRESNSLQLSQKVIVSFKSIIWKFIFLNCSKFHIIWFGTLSGIWN